MELIKEIRRDENYNKVKAHYEGVVKKTDLETLFNEAVSLHAGRLSRNLSGDKRYSPKYIIDANLRDLSYRARLVEIRVSVDRKLKGLQEMVDALKRYILTEYADDLHDYKTIEQRRGFAARVVKAQEQFLAEGYSLVAAVDTLIKDIDQSSYHFKTIIECLKLLDSSKGGKVL